MAAEADSVALLREEKDTDEEQQPVVAQGPNSASACGRTIAWQVFKGWWRHAVIVATPLLLLPLPLVLRNTAADTAYAIAIIAVYWITEAVPLAVTALLPLVLFPALGVQSADAVASNYLSDTNMLFVGGLMVAVAVEKWNLHKRLALMVLLGVGSKPKWLLLGFMSTTAFLSMWISNTATSAMMLPIAHAVLVQIKEQTSGERAGYGNCNRKENAQLLSARYIKSYNGGGSSESSVLEISNMKQEDEELLSEQDGDITQADSALSEGLTERKHAEISGRKDSEEEDEKVDNLKVTPDSPTQSRNSGDFTPASGVDSSTGDESFNRMSKVLMLGVAYSANIGGTATLTGTGPNLVLSGDVTKLFPASPGVNFGLWFVFAAPTMVLCLVCSWVYLAVLYCDDSLERCKMKFLHRKPSSFSSSAARHVIHQQYKQLGPWRFAEVLVLVTFIALALLWLFREPKFIPGWSALFPTDENGKSYFTDASTSMFIVFLLFVIPAKACCTFWRCNCPVAGSPVLLDWDSVQHKLPWNVVLLLGSGFALADAAQVSGLSCWIGGKLLGLENLPTVVMVLCVTVVVAGVTEVISNVATTTLFLPVLAQLAVALEINPLQVMIPAALAASYAFMLPVATPPNAIAFSFGYLKVYDMVLTGIFMNVLCILIVNISINSLAVPIFDLHTFPNWTNTSTGNLNCTY